MGKDMIQYGGPQKWRVNLTFELDNSTIFEFLNEIRYYQRYTWNRRVYISAILASLLSPNTLPVGM